MQNAQNILSFILNGEIVNIDFRREKSLTPTTTILNYLRSLPNYKGCKEGCAEGDCGACTIAIAALEDGKISYRAFDSCLLFLPMVHGKQLITVETAGDSKKMHPVQQAMVDSDGSQCGYCTPGFIMAMFALYKNSTNPSREVIDDALTGNLCRCTGYRPIVEATARACTADTTDHFTEKEPVTIELLKQINDSETLALSNKKRQYFLPFNLQEALALYHKYPGALLVSGATDIGLRVTKNKELLPLIIDLSAINHLKQIEESDKEVTFGAGVSFEEVKNRSKKAFPALYKMLVVFGSLQIRNVATFGGNLGTASPIGDTPPVLMAYDASVVLTSLAGSRKMKVEDFIMGYRKTALRQGEVISAVSIPKNQGKAIVEAYKVSKRKDLDISTVSTGFRLEKNENEVVEKIALIYGGMAAMTKRAAQTEEFLTGKTWSREIVEQAMDYIDKDFTPISDARSGAEGRRIMARNLLLKFWTEHHESENTIH